MTPLASVTIPTRNRAGILREAVRAALNQTVPLEIIVLDDGSTDETPEMMRSEFPQVRYERFAGANGPCVLRNRGAELASAPVLFPIDDDSVMVSPRTVEQTLAEFEHPRIGAVAIPYINVRQGNKIETRAPDGERIYICPAYLGASYAVRRDVFLQLHGYREQLFYMNEERDLSIRMLERGYVVRLGLADPIHHHSSPVRNSWRQRMLDRRNNICHAFWDVPFPHVLYHFPGTIASGLLYGLRNQCLAPTLAGYLQAPSVCLRSWHERRPVSSRTYLLMRRLNRKLCVPLAEIESELPSLPSTEVSAHR